MNSTQTIPQEINTLIFPVISLSCQIIMALILFCIKRLENSNFRKLQLMQENILETVSQGQSTSRQQVNEPFTPSSEEQQQMTHRDIKLSNGNILRVHNK